MIQPRVPMFSAATPLPPPGFDKVELPVHEMNLSAIDLLRIHRRSYDPIFYNRRSASRAIFRFDAPNDEYGVLYASPSFDVCMAETIMRARYHGIPASGPRVLDEHELTDRSVATLGFGEARSLRLADLTAPLWYAGFDASVLSTPDYSISTRWSLAIHAHPSKVDGIYFLSRYGAGAAVAIFSDRATLIQRGTSIPLTDYRGLFGYLERYRVALV